MVEITPPLFFDDDGDMLVFTTLQLASRYLEPADVRRNLIGYDSNGLLLGIREASGGIAIVALEAEPGHADDLHIKLASYLDPDRDPDTEIEKGLEQLINESLVYARF